LRALAGVLAIVGVLAFSQALARQIFIDSDGFPAARALGMTVDELRRVGSIRAIAIGVAAAVVALTTCIALSPLTPIGIARFVEPDPGPTIDAAFLGWGGAAIVGVVLLLSLVPAHRAARAQAERWSSPSVRAVAPRSSPAFGSPSNVAAEAPRFPC
jgi:hypothetical protein